VRTGGLALDTQLLVRPAWKRLLEEHHDLLVVGGGINGAGVARDAALRGLRVGLIERGDWGSGTSSRSSKLLHGGLRYLRQGSVRLVYEALQERERHLRLASGLVKRVRFRVPPTPRGTIPRWQVRAGIALYDLLAGGALSSGFWRDEPVYTDAVIDDARFCLEIVLDARRRGALALSYVEWLQWKRDGDRIVGARVRDRFTGEEGWLSASMFVNAAGPWADLIAPGGKSGPRLRLTRGTHIVLDRRADDDARLFFAPQDGRPLFLLPFRDRTSLLSTTDVDDSTPIREPVPQPSEVRYLRDAFRSQFPMWAHWNPVGVQCGLRPLLAGEGSPSSLTREERLLEDPSRTLISILGGKYTTYRAVAERVVDRVERRLGRTPRLRPTRTVPLPGGESEEDIPTRIRRAFAEEDAVRLEDVFIRRTAFGLLGPVDGELLRRAATLWRLRWGKGEAESEVETEAFLRLQERRSAPLTAWKG
jgi:glycerol-3-phosphate dehydrogenase